LINNNTNFLKNIVIFLRNCISGNEECYKKLAEILIKDLDICQKKIDKEYANNVLIPLLSLEKVTYLCLHPINEKIKNNYCSYINLETSDENQKIEENKEKEKNVKENDKLKLTTFSFSSLSKGNIIQKQEIKKEDKKEVESEKNQKSIIPESDLSDEYQNEFTQLFNSFEYQKDQKFPPMTFKKVMSSKGLTSDKLRSAIMNNVVNQGPFLIVLYPSKLEKYYKTHTFFYYNGTFPSLNLTQNFDESDENLTIPYNPQNMIAQISEKIILQQALNPN
jgi:hypothetical protein